MRSAVTLRTYAVLLTLSLVTTSAGCQTATGTGAGIGGALGTAAGLGIGAATGNPKTGAMIGGLAGAGTGALIGSGIDQKKEQEQRQIQLAQAQAVSAQAQQARMGITDVAQMAQKGFGDEVIINQIDTTGSTFQLSPADLDYLKANGVSDHVLVKMQNSRPRPMIMQPAPRPVVVRQQPTVIYEQPAPVYVVGPPRPRPGVMFVGGYNRCW